jgi:hypothetical protein
LVQNTGKTVLKTIKFEYWANNSTVKQIWTWAGNLASLDTVSIALPTWGLWDNGMLPSNNVFHCEISELNGSADEYAQNSKMTSPVTIPDVIPGNFKIEFRTNNNPTENTITLLDVDGKVVFFDSFTSANKLFTYPNNLNGCYKLIVKDYGLDGLNWWANTAQGTGFVRFRNGTSNAIIKMFNADFGSIIEYNFTTNYALNVTHLEFGNSINLYPNPVNELQSLHLNLNTIHSGMFSFQIHDVSGRIVTTVTKSIAPGLQSIDMEIPGLAAGTYQLFWTLDGDRLNKSGTHKLTVVK